MRSLVGSTPALFRPLVANPWQSMSDLIFRGRIPNGYLFDTEFNMWVRHEGDELTIGATSFGLFLAGTVIAFTPKPVGAQVACTRGFGTVECAKTVLALHAPVALQLTASNAAAEADPRLLLRDPYGAGWMVRGQAQDWAHDRARLVDAPAYRAHILACMPGAVIET